MLLISFNNYDRYGFLLLVQLLKIKTTKNSNDDFGRVCWNNYQCRSCFIQMCTNVTKCVAVILFRFFVRCNGSIEEKWSW